MNLHNASSCFFFKKNILNIIQLEEVVMLKHSVMLEILKQNQRPLKRDICEVGCFFRSSIALAEFIMNEALSGQEINSMWDAGIGSGYIKNRELIKGGAPIINMALDIFKEKGHPSFRAYEIGTSRGGVPAFYKGVSTSLLQVEDFHYIQKIVQPKGSAYPYHFRVVNSDGSLKWDPYEPIIRMQREDYTIIYAIKKQK